MSGFFVWKRLISVFLFLSLVLTQVIPTSANGALFPPMPDDPEVDPIDKIETELLTQLNAGQKADFFVWMAEKADLRGASSLAKRVEKGKFVLQALQATARRSQGGLLRQLDQDGIRYTSYYISNKVFVRSGSQALVMALANRPDVSRITANHAYQLEEPKRELDTGQTLMVAGSISFIHADDVWAEGVTGEGIVLAGNDTGLSWDHPAIINHYRGWNGVSVDHNYNWWDATGTYRTYPGDGHGHGTHTTGTMVGDDLAGNQIGVAPGAKTIHCKNMTDDGGGYDSTFIECFQWDLAPWDLNGQNPRPDLAPHAVNNSWGYGGGGVNAFREEIANLQAAGILVEVSAGNEGPGCSTLRSPGDYDEVLTTGSVNWEATDMPGVISGFSSRGPSALDGGHFPDVMAPGEAIRSAVPGDAYEAWGGTSMAGPHVTGLVGLLWSANPGLQGNLSDTLFIIRSTAVPLSGQTGSNCGGNYETGPNNDWGVGTIDALAAYQLAMMYGDPGTLEGLVTGADGSVLPGAQITATSGQIVFRKTTGPDGSFRMSLWEGTYDVTASLWGYQSSAHSAVVMTSNATRVENFSLAEAQTYTVSGKVIDLVTGWPVYARVRVTGTPVSPPAPFNLTWTSPLTGQYSITLPEGINYTLYVDAQVPGYQPEAASTGILTGDLSLDIGLVVDSSSCVAPGWGMVPLIPAEGFESGSLPSGWSVGDHTNSGAEWRFDDPAQRGNLTGGSGSFAIADSLYNGSLSMNTSLVTPVLDLSQANYPQLAFDTYYWHFYDRSEMIVEVSTDGSDWRETWHPYPYPSPYPYPYPYPYPGRRSSAKNNPYGNTIPWQAVSSEITSIGPNYHTTLDLSPYAGLSSVQIRFRYHGRLAYYWQLDNVGINQCAPKTGGFLAGRVKGPKDNPGDPANPSIEPVIGAVVAGPGGEDSTQSFATPEDPNLEDGYYILFSSNTGSQDFTATGKDGYGSKTDAVVVELNTVTEHDFVLPAGDLQTAPDELQMTLALGTGASTQLTLENTGSLSLNYQIYEIPTSPAFAAAGAPVQRIAIDASADSFLDEPHRLSPSTPLGAAPAVYPWIDVTPIPVGVVDNALVNLDGQLYSVGGLRSVGYYWDLADSYRYDPVTNTWSPIANPATIRQRPVAAAIAGKIYMTGGWGTSNTPIDSLEIYDPAADTWSTGASVPEAYAASAVVEYQGRMIVLGGRANSASTNVVYRYDPLTDAWTELASLPEPMSWQGCGVLQDTLVCAGGIGANGQLLDSVYAYSLSANTWSERESLPASVWGAAYAASGGLLYLSGGMVNDYLSNETFIYNGISDTWSSGPASNHAVYRSGSNCGFYKVGGINGWYPTSYTEVYPTPGNCQGEGVSWLTVYPAEGSISVGTSNTLNVFFDASVPEIEQPGVYKADVWATNNTPYGTRKVPAVMTVTAPTTWGELTGVISGLAHCDGPGQPLAGAQVRIMDGDVLVKTVSTGPEGQYSWWLEQGDYTLEVTAQKYISQSANVTSTAGAQTPSNFDLRLDESCPAKSLESIHKQVISGQTTEEVLTLSNSGAGEMAFEIVETPYLMQPPGSQPAQSFSAPAAAGPASIRSFLESQPAAQADPNLGLLHLASTGWFNGQASPLTLVRYAKAQCPETPNLFYAISGYSASIGASDQTLRYDADSNTWTTLAPIPFASEGPAAACYGGYIYVMGGEGTNAFYIYSVRDDSWQAGPALPRDVWGAAAAAWNGKVYLVGGDQNFSFGGNSIEVNIFDIATGTWSRGADLPVGILSAGYAQAGPYLYLVGGYGEAESTNLNVTLRYDLRSDTWETGPEFTSARADLALTATKQALYAIAGDTNGGTGFNPSNLVERLDLSSWPEGNWAESPASLPFVNMAAPGGFCTQAIGDSEIWNLAGYNGMNVTNINWFRTLSGEQCASLYEDVAWLRADPLEGNVPAGASASTAVTLDASDLAPGNYEAGLLALTDDAFSPQLVVPVSLEVLPVSYAFSVMPDASSKAGLRGGEVTYTLTLANQGNVAEKYQVVISGNTWVTQVPAAIGPVNPGESLDFTVRVAVPSGVAANAADQVAVQVASQRDPGQSSTANLTTTVGHTYDFRISPASMSGEGSSDVEVTYTIEVTNAGSQSDTYNIVVTENKWVTTVTGLAAPLAPGAIENVVVHVTIPASALNGSVDVAKVTLTSQGDPGKTHQVKILTTSRNVYAMSAAVNRLTASVKMGERVTYSVSVTNEGNVADNISFLLTGGSWQSEFSEQMILGLQPGETRTVTLTIFVPTDVEAFSTDTTSLVVSSGYSASVNTSFDFITTAVQHQVSLPMVSSQ